MNANHNKPSVFSSTIFRDMSSKLALIMMVTLTLSACQPADNVSNDISDNENNQALAPERTQTIEGSARWRAHAAACHI